jgi:hypothetical protein
MTGASVISPALIVAVPPEEEHAIVIIDDHHVDADLGHADHMVLVSMPIGQFDIVEP